MAAGVLADAIGPPGSLRIVGALICVAFGALFAAAPSLRQRDLVLQPPVDGHAAATLAT